MTMLKYDNGKSQWGLLPLDIIESVVRVLEFGATKYGKDNWKKGTDWSRVFNATIRHLVRIQAGEWLDPETGEPHASHAICNLVFLMYYQDHSLGVNDLWQSEALIPKFISLATGEPMLSNVSSVDSNGGFHTLEGERVQLQDTTTPVRSATRPTIENGGREILAGYGDTVKSIAQDIQNVLKKHNSDIEVRLIAGPTTGDSTNKGRRESEDTGLQTMLDLTEDIKEGSPEPLSFPLERDGV